MALSQTWLLLLFAVLCICVAVANSVCGDGMVDEDEECDDKNIFSGDGCDSSCHVEPGYSCIDPQLVKNSFYFKCAAFTYISAHMVTTQTISQFDNYHSSIQHHPYQISEGCVFLFVKDSSLSTYLVFTCGNANAADPSYDWFLEMDFYFSGVVGGSVVIKDDPSEIYYDSGTGTLQGYWQWPTLYTDGYVFGPVSPAIFSMTMQLWDYESVKYMGIYSNINGALQLKKGSISSMTSCSFLPADIYCFALGNSNIEPSEECDDGNTQSGDGCSATGRVENGWMCSETPSVCTIVATVCGNGVQEGLESCDDGNINAGDGCSAGCNVELGFACSGSPSDCSACGDGFIGASEQCDDGGTASNDGCSSTCQIESGYTCSGQPSICSICGDDARGGTEQCDDGNSDPSDGCSSTCTIETNWLCTTAAGAHSTCHECGNSVINPLEQCDDGGTASNDGCSSTCQIESGYTCSGQPSICESCGNGRLEGAETCDDGNMVPDDGCSDACQLEANYKCFSPSLVNSGLYVSCEGFVYLAAVLETNLTILAHADYQQGSMHTGREEYGTCIFSVVYDASMQYFLVFVCGKDDPKLPALPQSRLSVDFHVHGGADSASVVLSDDNAEVSYVNNSVIQGRWTWNARKTDGFVFGPIFPANFSMKMSVMSFEEVSTMKILSIRNGSLSEKRGPLDKMGLCTFEQATIYCFKQGNGILDSVEDCDDGNFLNGDGCSLSGMVEPGWECTQSSPSICQKCGNGVIEGSEECDDGNKLLGDGCSEFCVIDANYTCSGEPSNCSVCGDGMIGGSEECDDGNILNGDGCNMTCAIDPGYACEGSPSSCHLCGNGKIEIRESCDDGNKLSDDGCSSDCQLEPPTVSTNGLANEIYCFNTRLNETTCDAGYVGQCCLLCDDNYYRTRESTCLECDSSSDMDVFLSILPVWLAGLILVIVIIVGSVLLTDPQLDYLMVSLLTCQCMAEVGQLANEDLPSFIREFYDQIVVITLDFSFERATCFNGSFNFYWVFGLTLLLLPVILLVLWALLLVSACIRAVFYKTRSMRLKIFVYYCRRFVRASLWIYVFFYYILMLRALQVFSCTTLDGNPNIFVSSTGEVSLPQLDQTYLLAADPTIECYTHSHFIVSIIALIIASFGLIVYPAVVLLFVLFGRSHLHKSAVRGMVGNLFEGYRKNFYFIAALELSPDAGFALAAGIFWFDPILQFFAVAPAVVLLLMFCVIFPYRQLWENILQLMVLITVILSLLLMLCYTYDSGSTTDFFPPYFLDVFSLIVFLLSVGCLLYMVTIVLVVLALGIKSQFKFARIVRARSKPLEYGEDVDYDVQGEEEIFDMIADDDSADGTKASNEQLLNENIFSVHRQLPSLAEVLQQDSKKDRDALATFAQAVPSFLIPSHPALVSRERLQAMDQDVEKLRKPPSLPHLSRPLPRLEDIVRDSESASPIQSPSNPPTLEALPPLLPFSAFEHRIPLPLSRGSSSVLERQLPCIHDGHDTPFHLTPSTQSNLPLPTRPLLQAPLLMPQLRPLKRAAQPLSAPDTEPNQPAE